MTNSLTNKDFLKKLGKIGAGLFFVARHSPRPLMGRYSGGRKIKPKKLLALLVVITLLIILIPQHQAKADWWDPTSWAGSAATYFGGALADATIGNVITTVSALAISLVGEGIKWSANLLDGFIGFQTTNAVFNKIAVVDGSWTIIRNFVNLLFILVLIVMAFGTIFDIKNYTWRDVLPSFIISALLINFSLTIGQYIISIANGLAGVFLRQIQSAAAGGISATFAQGAGIVEGLVSTARTSAAAGLFVQAIFSIVFLTIFMLALMAPAIFSLVRIFMLWFLLIISPIAWFGYSLPSLRSKTWTQWWTHFLCWCFWLPYFLFFVMFAVIFINSKGTLPMAPGFFSNVGNSVMFFALSLTFLVGGSWQAMKLACATGTGVSKTFGSIESGVRKYAPGAAYLRSTGAGIKAGAQGKLDEYREQGVPIPGTGGYRFGGERAERLRTAKVAEIFGGKKGATETAQMAEIEKEGKRVREQLLITPADQQKAFLEAEKKKGGFAGQAAMLEYVKQGYSKKDDYVAAAGKYGGENNAFMRQYLENIKQAKFSDLFQSPDQELQLARGEIEGTQGLVGLRRELYKDLAKRNQISDISDYKKAKELLKPVPVELKSFLDSIKPEYILGTRDARQNALGEKSLGDVELERKLVEFMKDKKEINNVQLRQNALAIVGGKETIEGRNIVNEINKFNPIVNIEADLREERELPVGPLSKEDSDRVVTEISNKLGDKDFADIRKLSGEFWKDPLAQKAVNKTFDSGEISHLLEGANKEMKKALKNLPKEGRGEGDTRNPIGFVTPNK